MKKKGHLTVYSERWYLGREIVINVLTDRLDKQIFFSSK